MHTKIRIPVEKPFDLQAAIQSHGWVDLPPNSHDAGTHSFSRVEQLSSGKVVLVHVSGRGASLVNEVSIDVKHQGRLLRAEKKTLAGRVRQMLRLDEDLSEFYILCKTIGGKWTNFPVGQGYLLRSPEIFEDLVKVICTTNIQWSGTRRMVKELVETFGNPFLLNPDLKTFPAPEKIASFSYADFVDSVRLGYRARYVYELSVGIAEGNIVLSSFSDMNETTGKIKSRLLAIKGIGNYAAASMLMLLGRYDQIPVDSVFREYMRATYFEGVAFTDSEAMKVYNRWGEWKYLAYWFEMMNYYRTKEQ